MTAARLSPAASLLRNSKLFALPPAIALPVPEPSSEPVPRSDTATTIYPTRAAIETPLTSLGTGDWGFKRALPLKSTTKSGSPSVRLNKGIDTAEHIADFDSAADHVLTLKKFQELNQSIQHPTARMNNNKVHLGVFRKGHDNTTAASQLAPAHRQYTGVWPSLSRSDLQKTLPQALKSESKESSTATLSDQVKVRRWRYAGPSLVQMSGLEFDQWIKTLNTEKKKAFRDFVRRVMLSKKRSKLVSTAQDEGTVGEIDPATVQVSDEEVTVHLKELRQQPRAFGSLIAEFLDLPEGPSSQGITVVASDVWDYGRQTTASDSYGETGPPRTHPSAGLSYIHSNRWAKNDAMFGPQDQTQPVVGRQVKIRARGHQNNATTGVAGFIVDRKAHAGTIQRDSPAFEPQPGGQKTIVRPERAEVDEKGALKLAVRAVTEYQLENERAVHNSMVSDTGVVALRPGRNAGSRVMQSLTRTASNSINYKKRNRLTSESSDNDFDFLDRTS